jgi:hypothetical protein
VDTNCTARTQLRALRWIKKRTQPGREFVNFAQLTPPDNEDIPPVTAQPSPSSLVTHGVAQQFLTPERDAGLGDSTPAPAAVPVPEAAVDEDHESSGAKDDVRASRPVRRVQAKAISQRKEYPSHGALGAGVPATNLGHVLAAAPPTLCSACPPLRPNGAAECSHGWSAVRVLAGGAQPVEARLSSLSCPGGAEDSRRHKFAQSKAYFSSNSTP